MEIAAVLVGSTAVGAFIPCAALIPCRPFSPSVGHVFHHQAESAVATIIPPTSRMTHPFLVGPEVAAAVTATATATVLLTYLGDKISVESVTGDRRILDLDLCLNHLPERNSRLGQLVWVLVERRWWRLALL
jgi:hypothetical protein